MNKTLKIVVMPIVLMVLTIGLIVPIYTVIQEERCSLAFMKIISSDPVNIKPVSEIFDQNPDSVAYLMNHPKMTLKICLDYESEALDSDQAALVFSLAQAAYQEISNEALPENRGGLRLFLQEEDPALYDELTSKKK